MVQRIQLIIVFYFALISVDAQVINAGAAGNTATDLLARIDADVLMHKPDLVLVMIGTNDMLNSKKLSSYQQFSANVETLVKKLKNSNAEVILMSSPTVDSQYLFERHERKLFHEMPNIKIDSARQIISRTASSNQVHFIDIFQEFQNLNLPKHNEDLFILNPVNSGYRDGVHPTPLGYFFIAEVVFSYLKKNDLIDKAEKIVCFGDSITKGSKVIGSGTAMGETYPAFLQKSINNYFNEN